MTLSSSVKCPAIALCLSLLTVAAPDGTSTDIEGLLDFVLGKSWNKSLGNSGG